MSSKYIKKELQFAGKGHNETLEFANPLEHTRAATESVDVHVPGNGGTWNHIFVNSTEGRLVGSRAWRLRNGLKVLPAPAEKTRKEDSMNCF
jgi:hypothetical protein